MPELQTYTVAVTSTVVVTGQHAGADVVGEYVVRATRRATVRSGNAVQGMVRDAMAEATAYAKAMAAAVDNTEARRLK